MRPLDVKESVPDLIFSGYLRRLLREGN